MPILKSNNFQKYFRILIMIKPCQSAVMGTTHTMDPLDRDRLSPNNNTQTIKARLQLVASRGSGSTVFLECFELGEVRLRFRVSHRRRILTDEAGPGGLKWTICPTALSVCLAKLGSCTVCKSYVNSCVISTIHAWRLFRNFNHLCIIFLYTNYIIAHVHVHSQIFDLA